MHRRYAMRHGDINFMIRFWMTRKVARTTKGEYSGDYKEANYLTEETTRRPNFQSATASRFEPEYFNTYIGRD